MAAADQRTLVLVGVTVVALVVGVALFVRETARSSETTPPPQVEPTTERAVPSTTESAAFVSAGPLTPPLGADVEKDLVQHVVQLTDKWWAQKNDLQREGVFDEARGYARTFFAGTTTVVGWRGNIEHFAKQEGGDDVCLMIRLPYSPSEIRQLTFTQGCSGTALNPDTNGIKKGTPVYEQLKRFDEGQSECVVFSADVDSVLGHHDDPVNVMKWPSFDVTFTSIAPCLIGKVARPVPRGSSDSD